MVHGALLQEIDPVGRQAFRMAHRVAGQGLGHDGEPIGRQRARDDEHAVVRTAVPEEIDRETNEIVPVARDQAASVLLGPFELFPIRLSLRPDLVDADGILAPLPKQFGNPGTQVLVEMEFHGRVTASEGC